MYLYIFINTYIYIYLSPGINEHHLSGPGLSGFGEDKGNSLPFTGGGSYSMGIDPLQMSLDSMAENEVRVAGNEVRVAGNEVRLATPICI
jgi:hypothetical protein